MKNINSDLLNTLDDLSRTRGIDRETLLTLVEESLLSAARKAMSKTREVTVHIDRKTGAIKCLAKLFVVHVVENPKRKFRRRPQRLSETQKQSAQRLRLRPPHRPKAPTSAKDAKSGKTTQTPKAMTINAAPWKKDTAKPNPAMKSPGK